MDIYRVLPSIMELYGDYNDKDTDVIFVSVYNYYVTEMFKRYREEVE